MTTLADLVADLAVEYLPGMEPDDTAEEVEAVALAVAAITRVAAYVSAARNDELAATTNEAADDDLTLDALGWLARHRLDDGTPALVALTMWGRS